MPATTFRHRRLTIREQLQLDADRAALAADLAEREQARAAMTAEELAAQEARIVALRSRDWPTD